MKAVFKDPVRGDNGNKTVTCGCSTNKTLVFQEMFIGRSLVDIKWN